MDKKKVGNFIKILREEKNMTRYQLADLLYVNERYIEKVEKGTILPNVKLFRHLKEIFKVSYIEIINGKKITNKNRIKEMNKLIRKELNICDDIVKRKSNFVTFLMVIFLVLLFFLVVILLGG